VIYGTLFPRFILVSILFEFLITFPPSLRLGRSAILPLAGQLLLDYLGILDGRSGWLCGMTGQILHYLLGMRSGRLCGLALTLS